MLITYALCMADVTGGCYVRSHVPAPSQQLADIPVVNTVEATRRRHLCSQVFCSKQQPRCGTCPLQSMCEYALHKGPCMATPLADAAGGAQPAVAAGPALAVADAQAGEATRGSGSTTGQEATGSLAATAQRVGTGQDAVPDDAARSHAAPRAVPLVLSAAEREVHVLRILAAAVEARPDSTEQTPPSEPVEMELNRHVHMFLVCAWR